MSVLTVGLFCDFCNVLGCVNNFSKLLFSASVFCCYRRLITKRHKCAKSLSKVALSSNWKAVVGLEIHAQIQAQSKLFSGAGTKFAAPVNSQVALFDAAIPGTLPVLNARCVEAAVLTAFALNCKVNLVSKFDRKHYFYADLPAGYQITQQRMPLATDGHINFVVFNSASPAHSRPREMSARIVQLQLEQDSGKSLHDEENQQTLVDLNRAGIGLMEIVTAPDMEDGEEAAALVKELQLILQTIGTCTGKMEEGSLRVDANISVHKPGEPLGVRTEVKNLNSVRFIAKAIDYEISNHIKILEDGGIIENETKSFDFHTNTTVSMRDKEMKQDYRFMPEPNLPPLRLYTDETVPRTGTNLQFINVDKLKASLPVLPAEKREHLLQSHRLPMDQTLTLTADDDLLVYFESMLTVENVEPRVAARVLLHDLQSCLKSTKISISECNVQPLTLAEISQLLSMEKISQPIGTKLVNLVFEGEQTAPTKIVASNDWWIVNDSEHIKKLCTNVITHNPKLVKKFKSGKQRGLTGLVHHVQELTKDCTNPLVVSNTLKKLIKENYTSSL